MSRPDPQSQAAMSAAFSGAVDLSALKDRATASARPSQESSTTASDTGSTRRSSPYIIDATEATFNQVIQASAQVLVVVDLWATWCEPCKQLSPVLEDLAADGDGSWVLAKVDVDANPRIAQAFQAQSIPMVVALAAGQPVDAFTGVQPKAQIEAWLAALKDQLREKLPGIKAAEDAAPAAEPEPEDPRITKAVEATDRGDYEAAAAAYQEILDVEPTHVEAQSGLQWSRLFARAAAAPQDAQAVSDDDATHVAAAIAAADVDVATGHAADGFARLLATVKVSVGDDKQRAQDHLLRLFDLFAADDPDVVSARRSLAALLY